MDPQPRQLRYVVGAHQPSPIFVTDGKASLLPGKGKPAGIFDNASWAVEQMQVPDDFAFLLFSDGIYDLLEGNELEDKETKLLKCLESSPISIESIQKLLSLDTVTEPQDDISVLLLKGGL